jgi:hypothetical protein
VERGWPLKVPCRPLRHPRCHCSSPMGIIDPLLGPLADNGGPARTHALRSGSPAIDAGDPDFAAPPDFDRRGNPRVADGNADDVPRIDTRAFELLRGDVNGDG